MNIHLILGMALTTPISSYRSRFREDVRQEVHNRLKHHQTFGFPVEPLHPPTDFLRKRSRSASAAAFKHRPDHNHFEVRLKAPLDHLGGKIVHHNVNHLRENIKRAESAKPRRRPGTCSCDTRRGDFFPVEQSGLVPKYVLQTKFGRVPKYIEERKKDAEMRAKQEQERMRESQRGPKLISEQERLEMLQGLRANWDTLQQAYKRLSLLTDTIPKKARKTQMENELKQIEKDMLFLENNRYIAIQE